MSQYLEDEEASPSFFSFVAKEFRKRAQEFSANPQAMKELKNAKRKSGNKSNEVLFVMNSFWMVKAERAYLNNEPDLAATYLRWYSYLDQ